MRGKVTNEKPYIVMGVDRWQTGPRKALVGCAGQCRAPQILRLARIRDSTKQGFRVENSSTHSVCE